MVRQPHLTTRSVSLVMLAAFAAAALWLFVPWRSFQPGGSGGGRAAGASTIRVDGDVSVESHDDVITRLVVPVVVGGAGVRLPDRDGALRAETSLSDTAAAAVPGAYAVHRLDGNGDDVLDPGEHALLIVDLPERTSVHPGNPLRLVLQTADGGSLAVEDVVR